MYYEARDETGPSSYEPQVIIKGGPNHNIIITRRIPGLQIGQLTRHEIDMTEVKYREWSVVGVSCFKNTILYCHKGFQKVLSIFIKRRNTNCTCYTPRLQKDKNFSPHFISVWSMNGSLQMAGLWVKRTSWTFCSMWTTSWLRLHMAIWWDIAGKKNKKHKRISS